MRGRPGRVAKGVAALLNDGWATRFSDWSPGQELGKAPQGFNEATRCAELIIERWFRNHS